MTEFLLPFIILTLIAVIIIQAVERYFYAKQEQAEKSKLIAAVLSKNINDYTHAVRVEKEEKAPGFSEPKETELGDATPDEFMQHIRAMNEDKEEEEI